MSTETEDTIIKVISAISGIAVEEIDIESTNDSLGLDSLEGIEIVIALEEEFDIDIDDDDIDDLSSVRRIVEYVENEGFLEC